MIMTFKKYFHKAVHRTVDLIFSLQMASFSIPCHLRAIILALLCPFYMYFIIYLSIVSIGSFYDLGSNVSSPLKVVLIQDTFQPPQVVLSDKGQLIATPTFNNATLNMSKTLSTFYMFETSTCLNKVSNFYGYREYKLETSMITQAILWTNSLIRVNDPEDPSEVYLSLSKIDSKVTYENAVLCTVFMKALKFQPGFDNNLNEMSDNEDYHQEISFNERLQNVLMHSFTKSAVIGFDFPDHLDLFPGVVFKKNITHEGELYNIYRITNLPLVSYFLKVGKTGYLYYY